MAEERRNKTTILDPKPLEKELPHHLFVDEILTRLPTDDVLRCKSVCKKWCSSIKETSFVLKHMARTTPMSIDYQWRIENNRITRLFDARYECLSPPHAGFLVERHCNHYVYRIKNPATQRFLRLPNPHNFTCKMNCAFDSSTGEVKLASFYVEKDAVGCEVMNVGKDVKWRSLETPKLGFGKEGKWVSVRRKFFLQEKIDARICYCAETITDGDDWDLEVKRLDLWNESFLTVTMERDVFLDLMEVSVIPWNNSIAVVEIVENSLHALVLEDFEEQRWSRKKMIVSLEFLKLNPLRLKDEDVLVPMRVDSDVLKIWNEGSERMVWYDMKMEMVKRLRYRTFDTLLECFYQPSMISFEGMMPVEDEF